MLAWALERASGQRLHELIARWLWQPMGAESDAEITVDGHGNPMADGGMCTTLRDLARFGQLYLQEGRAVVPRAWVRDMIRGARDGPGAFVQGDNPPGYPHGAHYRNCWWVRDPTVPFYHALGINWQHLFIHVPSQTVVAKLSSWPVALSTRMLDSTVAGVLAIAEALEGHGPSLHQRP